MTAHAPAGHDQVPAPIVEEILPPYTADAFAALAALRPALTSVEGFTRLVDEVQRPQGYRIAATRAENGAVVAAAGFRAFATLAWGLVIYVDDLTTLPEARRAGHATALLSWIGEEAGRLGCRQIHLDSNIGPARLNAHRLYANVGFGVTSLHFSRSV